MGKRGRPSIYSQELADRICAELADGKSLREVCSQDDMPDERTVRTWAINDQKPEDATPETVGFSPQYAKAREAGYALMADELLEIADDGSNDWIFRNKPDNPGYEANGEHIQRSRLRVDTRKWFLSKVLPKVYGDKQTLEHTGKDGSDLLPPPDTRQLARAVVALLQKAKVQEG